MRKARFRLGETPDRGNPPPTPLRSVRPGAGRCSSAIQLDAFSLNGLPPGRDRTHVENPRFSLLPDTKRTEDQIEDVIGSSSASNRVKRSQRVVKIQQEHFVRNFCLDGRTGGSERRQRILN